MSLWLTRIQLDLRDYAVRRDLASAVQLHRTMMSMMPAGLGDNPRSRSGLLFRVEETRTATSLLVQSRYQPDVTRLPSGYRDAMTKSLDGLLGGLANATRVRFRIVGNPTKRTPRGHENPGKVVALRGADVEQWWIRRARDSGLIVSAVVATQLSDISERRHRHSGPIRHVATRFDGIATIHDVDLVRSAVADGIGRGKSYGCGLLSLLPANSEAPADSDSAGEERGTSPHR